MSSNRALKTHSELTIHKKSEELIQKYYTAIIQKHRRYEINWRICARMRQVMDLDLIKELKFPGICSEDFNKSLEVMLFRHVMKNKRFKEFFRNFNFRVKEFSISSYWPVEASWKYPWIFRGITKIVSQTLKKVKIQYFRIPYKHFVAVILSGPLMESLTLSNGEIREGAISKRINGKSSLKELWMASLMIYANDEDDKKDKSDPNNIIKMMKDICFLPCIESLTFVHIRDCCIAPSKIKTLKEKKEFERIKFTVYKTTKKSIIG
ncbi:unnamed protein product [Moneuplotes crassus]|uniref:Uncharacterized protein n=1 Tax=Euplotes crassus TaxID=5936 RepID=A0AAD1XV54_EUPCR|nr:unnamed protein product [Moneuplotes crassus]